MSGGCETRAAEADNAGGVFTTYQGKSKFDAHVPTCTRTDPASVDLERELLGLALQARHCLAAAASRTASNPLAAIFPSGIDSGTHEYTVGAVWARALMFSQLCIQKECMGRIPNPRRGDHPHG